MVSPSSINCARNPLDILSQMLAIDFVHQALLTGTILALGAGLVGYFVVLRGLIFAADTLAHVTFTGGLGAAALGVPPFIGLVGLTLLTALGMGLLQERLRTHDAAVAMVLTWVLGWGALFISIYTARGTDGTIGVHLLFGSILAVEKSQVLWIVLVGLVCTGLLLGIARPLLFASLDPELALGRGIPVRGLGIILLLLIALGVTSAVPAVGALLNSALLITPAAIAQRLCPRPYLAMGLSGLLAVLFTWAGLGLGFCTPYPISFFISSLAFIAYGLTVIVRR